MRISKRIGSDRSDAQREAGNKASGAAKASAAIKTDRFILPLSRPKPVFWRGLSTFWLGFGGAKYPRAYVLVHLRDSGLV